MNTAFKFNDGGRSAAGYRGTAGDCVVRSIAIALQLPYQTVYDALNDLASRERSSKRQRKSNSRSGVRRSTVKRYLVALGWEFKALMGIGTGCKVHLRADELPKSGRLILSLSKHYCAFIDGVIHDLYDPSRDGTRCVYGYWFKKGASNALHVR